MIHYLPLLSNPYIFLTYSIYFNYFFTQFFIDLLVLLKFFVDRNIYNEFYNII